jgi:hypothetical protein
MNLTPAYRIQEPSVNVIIEYVTGEGFSLCGHGVTGKCRQHHIFVDHILFSQIVSHAINDFMTLTVIGGVILNGIKNIDGFGFLEPSLEITDVSIMKGINGFGHLGTACYLIHGFCHLTDYGRIITENIAHVKKNDWLVY